MSQLYALAGLTAMFAAFFWLTLNEENRLKGVTAALLVMALVGAPTLNYEWSRMTSELVSSEGDPHDGLPDLWDGKQVVCIHFPADEPHADYTDGRYHIDYDGTAFLTDTSFNGSAACVGGFSGYENGFDLFLEATNVTDNLAVGYTVSEWGPYVHSIGGVDANTLTGDFSGAYWSLYHNGALSMVGIGDLVLSEDSVVLWQVDTW